MFVERSTQYTSLSSRKQPANAGTERKQFTENASVALQQPILTHAHTKCPPVAFYIGRSLVELKQIWGVKQFLTRSRQTEDDDPGFCHFKIFSVYFR